MISWNEEIKAGGHLTTLNAMTLKNTGKSDVSSIFIEYDHDFWGFFLSKNYFL